MCKDDPCGRLLMLSAQLDDLASKDKDKGCSPAESPGTPPGSQDKPEAFALSESSTSGDDTANSKAVFFARVPPLVPYQDLLALFSKFGTVSDLNLFRRWATARTSKGCGIVKFCKAEAASAALLDLNGVHSFDAYPGCEGPMVVEWMDESRLSSAAAAAAAKAAKAQAAGGSRSQQKPRSKPSNGSNSSAGKNSLPNWSYMQRMGALAQQYSNQSSAMAALAAAGMGQGGFAGGLHPAVEALDLGGLYAGGPLSLDDVGGSCGMGPGLGDPSSWSTVIPVHLLPMLGQSTGQAADRTPSNMASLSPMLPADAFSQMSISSALMPSPAAAALPSPGSNAPYCLETFMSGPQRSAGSFGSPTPSIEPWLSGGLPSRTDSTNLSFSSQVAPAFGAGGNSASFLAAAAAAAEQQQQLQQQQVRPLVVLDDPWVPQSCDGYASAPANTANTGHVSSGSYGLFDNSSLLLHLNEAATAAGASVAASASYGNSILRAPCAGAGAMGPGAADVTGFLSGHLSSVLTQSEEYMSLQAGAGGSVSGALHRQGACGGSSSGAQVDAATVYVPLTDAMHSAVARHIVSISSISGAKVGTVFDSVTGGWQLTLQGTSAAVEAGRNLVHLLSQGN